MTERLEKTVFRCKNTGKYFDFAELNGNKVRIWTKSLKNAKHYDSAFCDEAIFDLCDTKTLWEEIETVTLTITLEVK